METTEKQPSLGVAALDVWRNWREISREYFPGYTTFGYVPHLGEVFWKGEDLCRYTTYPCFEAVSTDLEDQYWGALCEGMLQIHRRRYAPLVDADESPKVILHAVTGEPMPLDFLDAVA